MRYPVVLTRRADGSYQAAVPLLPGVVRSAATRTATLSLIQQAIAAELSHVEVVYVDGPENLERAEEQPWHEQAGMFADDPTLGTLLEEIYALRDSESAV